MPRGGKRPGAGRKQGYKEAQTITKELAKEALRKMVYAEQEPMTRAQIEAAKGLNIMVVRDAKTGKFLRRIKSPEEFDAALSTQDAGLELLEVWPKEPGVQAYAYLMDQAIDKAVNPKQEVDLNITGLSQRLKAARERARR